MTQATKQSATTTRRTGGSRSTPTGHGPHEHDLRTQPDLVGDRDQDAGNERHDRTKRNERDAHDQPSEPRARHEQDAPREDRADDHDARTKRNARDEQSDQRQRAEHGERGDGREPRRESGGVQRTLARVTDPVEAAAPNSADAFAAAPDMSKALTAWFDMAGHMMKQQQQFFATMLGAGNTNTRTTTNARTTTKV